MYVRMICLRRWLAGKASPPLDIRVGALIGPVEPTLLHHKFGLEVGSVSRPYRHHHHHQQQHPAPARSAQRDEAGRRRRERVRLPTCEHYTHACLHVRTALI